MVEFALVLLVFLGLTMAIFEGARLALAAWAISTAARDGARAGIYLPCSTPPPSGGCPANAPPIATIDSRIKARAQATAARLGIVVPDANVVICRHTSLHAAVTDTCDTTAPPLKSGSVIDVTVRHTFSFVPFAGDWLGQGNRELTGYHRARIE
jgi:hypothetical protein